MHLFQRNIKSVLTHMVICEQRDFTDTTNSILKVITMHTSSIYLEICQCFTCDLTWHLQLTDPRLLVTDQQLQAVDQLQFLL